MSLMRLVATQVTVVQPLYHQVAEVGLHLAFMQPLILGAARIDVLAAADVQGQGYGKGYGNDYG